VGQKGTHPVLSKHSSGPQSQIFTSWLFSGEQPQGPIRHRFGKSSVFSQHIAIVTVPPEFIHACSCSVKSAIPFSGKIDDEPLILISGISWYFQAINPVKLAQTIIIISAIEVEIPLFIYLYAFGLVNYLFSLYLYHQKFANFWCNDDGSEDGTLPH